MKQIKIIIFGSILFFAFILIGNSQPIMKTKNQLAKEKDERYMKNATLEDQYYKQKDYVVAMKYWRVLYNTYPISSKNIYLHGVKMYKSFAKKHKKDKVLKAKYLDTLMAIYDNRIKYFKEEGKVLRKKGVDLFTYDAGNIENVEKAFLIMESSIKITGEKSSHLIFTPFMKALVKLFKKKKIDKEKVVNVFSMCMAIIEKNIKSNKKNAEKFKTAKNNVEKLFTDSGAADCESLIPFFTPQFEQNKTDIELLKKITTMLLRAKCKNSELFANAAIELYNLEPSASAAYNLANLFFKKENYEKSSEFYLKSIELEEDSVVKATYYYELALITNGKLKDKIKAVSYCRKATKFNKNYGKPYILIGNIYLASKNSCGSNNFEKKAVYWIVVDKFIKARSVDENIKEEANKLIATYRKYFPGQEDAFFRGVKDGATYKVGCWINETTKVRFLTN